MFKKTGIDISKRRLDGLSKKALSFCLEDKNNTYLEVGGSSGKMSLLFSQIGKKVFYYDRKVHISLFFLNHILCILFPIKKIKFKKSKIENLNYKDLPENISCVFASRVFHYLKYKDLKKFFNILKKKLKKEGRVFASFSGLESVLSENYPAEIDVEERFFELSQENQFKFGINQKVTLFTKNEVKELVSCSGFEILEIYQTDFGNINVVFKK